MDNDLVSAFGEAVMMGSISLVGLVLNFVAFLIFIRHHAFHNSFGYLAACHAISNSSILLIFALWATPWTFLLVAVAFPALYRRVFSDHITGMLLVLVTFISASYSCIYFLNGCKFYFDHSVRSFEFGKESCSQWMAFYIDMSYNISLFVFITCIDIVAFLFLRAADKRLLRLSGRGAHNEDMRRLKRDARLFLQGALNSLMYSFMLLCFHLFSNRITSQFGYFLCTTFMWAFSHAFGGAIMIGLNPEIRRHLVGFRHFLVYFKNLTCSAAVRPMQVATAT